MERRGWGWGLWSYIVYTNNQKCLRKVNQNFNRSGQYFFTIIKWVWIRKQQKRVQFRPRWKRPYLYTSFADVPQSNCTRVSKAHLGWLHFDIHLFNVLSYCGTSCLILSESVILLSLHICIIMVWISDFSVYVYVLMPYMYFILSVFLFFDLSVCKHTNVIHNHNVN